MTKLPAVVVSVAALFLSHGPLEGQEETQESERETIRIEFKEPLEIRGGPEKEPREPGGPGEGPGGRGEVATERSGGNSGPTESGAQAGGATSSPEASQGGAESSAAPASKQFGNQGTDEALHRGAMCLRAGYPSQVSSSTCQSRVLALALGKLNPQLFPINSYEALTGLERTLRVAIEGAASEDRSAVLHTHWEAALREVTGDLFELTRHELQSIEAVTKTIADITGATISTRAPDDVHAIPAKRVAGVSVTKIAEQTYPSGHVVAVLAVDLATSELIIANSWQKDETGKPLYEGHIVQTKDISFKNYGGAKPVYYVFEVTEK